MRLSLKIILTIFVSFCFSFTFGQYFQGEVDYGNYYFDKNTRQQMFAPITETVSIKDGKYKIKLDSPQAGALDWDITDYVHNVEYSRESDSNRMYPIYDSTTTISSDGTVHFGKPVASYVSPIIKGKACLENPDTTLSIEPCDTIAIINGFKSHLIIMKQKGMTIGNYYYCDSIHIDPLQYNCSRSDGLDLLYRYTKGALITKIVRDEDAFYWVYQIRAVRYKKVNKSVFDIPKGIKIIERQ